LSNKYAGKIKKVRVKGREKNRRKEEFRIQKRRNITEDSKGNKEDKWCDTSHPT